MIGPWQHVDTFAGVIVDRAYWSRIRVDLEREWDQLFTPSDDVRTSSKAYRVFFAEHVESVAATVERWDGPDGSWLAVADGLRGSQGNRTRGENALLVNGMITGALVDQYRIREDDLYALGQHDPVHVRRHGVTAPGVVSPQDAFRCSPYVAELARAIDDADEALAGLDTVRGSAVEWCKRAVPTVAPLAGFDVRAVLSGMTREKVAA